MTITFDPAKRDVTLRERGFDFGDADKIFSGPIFTQIDARRDYGEVRSITVGLLDGRMVVVGWTMRGSDRHVFTMRKANAREQKRYASRLR